MNPYQVLGVSPNSTKDQLHDAYRQLVKKNHPDKFTDPAMKHVAEGKIKEINAAYDLVKNGDYNPNQSAGQRGPFNGYTGYSGNTGSAEFAHIRQMVNDGNVQGAYNALNGMNNKNAEWHYLMGIVSLRMGRYDTAREELYTATNMDPSNSEYSQAYASLLNYGGRYNTKTTTHQSNMCCNCCTYSLCANCMCGGLDRCCCTCC